MKWVWKAASALSLTLALGLGAGCGKYPDPLPPDDGFDEKIGTDVPCLALSDGEGVYEEDFVVQVRAAEPTNEIYYTLDGTSPVTDGTLYYAPIYLESGSYTVMATSCNEKGYYSPVVTEEVKVEVAYQLDMPQVTPDSGEYLTRQTIYVNVPDGCSAYYTWNGPDPTTASSKYSGGIAMPEGNNVLAVIVVDQFGNTSSVQRVNYIYMP